MRQQELIDKIAARIENDGDLIDSLDGLVIDIKCQEASDINNSGYEEQCKYLLECGFFTVVEIAEALEIK